MKISTLLDYIDNGHMALPEFQRGYVWNRDQVRSLFDSLYRKHPVGGLLIWATESKSAVYRGDGEIASGVIKLLLDGQQRMTSIYGIVRGKPPKFFDGNALSFTGLYFNLESEQFMFYSPLKMQDDPLWVNVTELMVSGYSGIGAFSKDLVALPNYGSYISRLSGLLSILDILINVEEVTGSDKSIDIVVEIFNKVNSGGTKLSKGDLALAKICAEWPEARETMKTKLKAWKSAQYNFNLDWLLRSINTVLTGEAKFQYLHNKNSLEISEALKKASRHIDTSLNLISGRLGLDHDQVLFSRYAIPVMVRFLDQQKYGLDEKTRDKLLFWFAQAGMWGRFSGSTESFIDKDLNALEASNNNLDNLIEQLRLWHGGLRVEAGHFNGWSLGARFYPVLYMLTRMGEARDWGLGIPLKASMLGKMNKLEVHHIFPKAKLYEKNYSRSQVNSLANFCFLTKDTNITISAKYPEVYFEEIESKHPGALASQWIPMDKNLWKIDNYLEFLKARQLLLAEETNRRMAELLHGEGHWLEGPAPAPIQMLNGGIITEAEEKEIEALIEWIADKKLPDGILLYDFSDPDTGEQKAIFDLAWPNGIQEELSQPVALLLNESSETISVANAAGFRCFTAVKDFKNYVYNEILTPAND